MCTFHILILNRSWTGCWRRLQDVLAVLAAAPQARSTLHCFRKILGHSSGYAGYYNRFLRGMRSNLHALQQVSPDEVTAAYILAIARDVGNEEADETLQAWKKFMLSTTCRFVVLPTQMSMYWYALTQRDVTLHGKSGLPSKTRRAFHTWTATLGCKTS